MTENKDVFQMRWGEATGGKAEFALMFFAGMIVHLLFAECVFTLCGQGRVIFRAKRDALLGLPKMWRKRAILQTMRTVSPGEIWRVLDKRTCQ